MSNYGLKIAKSGGNVLKDPDSGLVFSSLFKTMPVAKEGSFDVVGNSGDLPTITIKHNQPFIPAFLLFYKASGFPTVWQWAPDGGASFLLGTGSSIFSLRIDKENIIVRINFNNTTPETISIKYYVFAFPIALSI